MRGRARYSVSEFTAAKCTRVYKGLTKAHCVCATGRRAGTRAHRQLHTMMAWPAGGGGGGGDGGAGGGAGDEERIHPALTHAPEFYPPEVRAARVVRMREGANVVTLFGLHLALARQGPRYFPKHAMYVNENEPFMQSAKFVVVLVRGWLTAATSSRERARWCVCVVGPHGCDATVILQGYWPSFSRPGTSVALRCVQ